jgi:hypothetical protein
MADRNDELAHLRAENARLVGLLEAHGIAWQAPAAILKPSAASSLTTPTRKSHSSASCSEAAPTFIQFAGKARPAKAATLPPVRASGVPVSAKSLASNAVTVSSGNCCR